MKETSHHPPLQSPHLAFLMYICIASALGGLLWGFDAIVISGTINAVKEQFDLSPSMEGFFVSSGLLGAVFGSGLSGWLSDRFGRSRNLLFAAILMMLSAIGSAWASGIELLVFARLLGGIGVGVSAMVCPLYISEISPSHLRGRLVTVFQFAITLGIMLALVNNYLLFQWAGSVLESTASDSFLYWFVGDETWRAMFASELVPGLCFLVMAFFLPESPRWLVKVGRPERAKLVLGRIFREGSAEVLEEIQETLSQEQQSQKRFLDVFQAKYRKHLVLAMGLAAFAQFSGINVVFYYGTSLLESAGFQSDGALSGMAIIGGCNMVFTMVAMAFVDKLGRKKLLQWGTLGSIACLAGIGVSFYAGGDALLIALMCLFVAFFAFSLGPIKFIFASEIFPTSIRSHAMAIVILTMWASDTLVGQITPSLREAVGPAATFFTFAAILVPQIWIVWRWMPETAGMTLEEIEKAG